MSELLFVSIPKNIQKTLSDPKWRKAMQKVMKALHKNNTPDLVKFPKGKRGQLDASGYLLSSIEPMFSGMVQGQSSCKRFFTNLWN